VGEYVAPGVRRQHGCLDAPPTPNHRRGCAILEGTALPRTRRGRGPPRSGATRNAGAARRRTERSWEPVARTPPSSSLAVTSTPRPVQAWGMSESDAKRPCGALRGSLPRPGGGCPPAFARPGRRHRLTIRITARCRRLLLVDSAFDLRAGAWCPVCDPDQTSTEVCGRPPWRQVSWAMIQGRPRRPTGDAAGASSSGR
jgi:hypothetical protein